MDAGTEGLVRRLALLARASRLLETSADLDSLLDQILEAVEEIFGLETCAILLFDEDMEVMRIERARGYDEDVVATFRARRGEGITGLVVESGEATVVPDVTKDPRYQGGAKNSRSEMAAPLRIGGHTLGVLDAESARVAAFDQADLELFSAFAAHAALAVDAARMRETLEQQNRMLARKARRLGILNQVGRTLCSVLERDKLVHEILRLAREALELPRCAVLLVDPTSKDLVIQAALGYGGVSGMRIPEGQGITGHVAKTGEPIRVPDVSRDQRYIPGELQTGSEMAAPMLIRGELVGVLDAGSPMPDAFDDRDLELFASFASYAAVAIHNAAAFERGGEPAKS